ncbi:hypothetical protein P8452_76996 [Trifolium repens]|nr:hypothetical protein P8452_76996 [Trifolium repens]
MAHSNSDQTHKMLDAYIYDYLMKRELYETAKAFHDEGAVETDVVIDAPGGFLYEWWTVFWELFMAKQGLSNSEPALSYLQAQEMRKQEELESIQFALQSPAQQQQYGAETQVLNGNVLCPINYGPLARQNRVASNTMAPQLSEDRLKSPLHGNDFGNMLIEIMESYTRGGNPIEDSAFLWNATTALTGGQASGQTFPSAPSILQGNRQQVQNLNRLLLGSTQYMNSDMSAMMRSRAVVSEGSLIGFHGSNQGGSDLTLKGRPVEGLEQLHAEILQKHNLRMSSQYSNQFSQRQQLMLQAQQNLFNPSVSSFDSKRPRVLVGRGGQSNPAGGSVPNIGTPQIDSPELFPFLKDSKSGVGRKQKRKVGPYSGPGSSSGTANTVGPSSGSPSTPSMQTPLPTPQQNDLGSLAATQNQLADKDHLKSDGSLGEKFESFSSLADTVHKGRVGIGFSLKEIKHGMASSHKVDCCHFSSDGKLLVTGGHDKKASLWCTKSFNLQSTLEEHTQWITDVRFCPSMFCVATSSADKTVKVWDVNNPGHSIRTFTGSTAVMSIDFHPSKDDLICSCDNKEIRYWSIGKGSLVGVYKGAVTRVRFQPGLGKLLAAAVNNLILILDAETLRCKFKLEGHKSPVHSLCWHSSGDYLASVSGDQVKIWAIGSDSCGVCIQELNSHGTNEIFKTCVFHPICHVLIIGYNESLMLWNFIERQKMTVPAHDNLVSALAVSDVTGLVASVSHDKHFKIWK